MPITLKDGNAVDAVLNGEVDFLLHCANCQAKMFSGIAKEIADRIPWARTVDIARRAGEANDGQRLLGNISIALLPKDDQLDATENRLRGVINLYGQLYPGFPVERPLNYAALASALQQAAKFTKGARVGLPWKMASDRAGGDWEIVLEFIKWHFKDHEVIIYRLG